MNDSELLERYAASGCDRAFAELVKRYVDLVYCAALRQVGGDPHLAQDGKFIAEIARPVDDEYDTRFEFGLNSRSSNSAKDTGRSHSPLR